VDDVSGPMWVGFGRSNRNSYRAADLISVDQIKIHGNYDLATIVNDIAVVRLVERPTRAQVVDLAEESAPRFTGAVAEIVGFGRGTNGPLLRGVTRVIGTQECREWYSIVTANNICVRDNVGTAQSACSGDSGGPLYIRGTGEQAGIASFAEADCSIDAPQGYTRVSSFRRWIRQATGGL
ncbi:MAG: trypsin-like serine protease, partial [Myxococcota bacterium]